MFGIAAILWRQIATIWNRHKNRRQNRLCKRAFTSKLKETESLSHFSVVELPV